MLGDFAGGFFEEFVDESLVGFGLLGGHAAELAEMDVGTSMRREVPPLRADKKPSALRSG